MKSKSYLLSFAKVQGSIAAALAAVLMTANTTVALAHIIRKTKRFAFPERTA